MRAGLLPFALCCILRACLHASNSGICNMLRRVTSATPGFCELHARSISIYSACFRILALPAAVVLFLSMLLTLVPPSLHIGPWSPLGSDHHFGGGDLEPLLFYCLPRNLLPHLPRVTSHSRSVIVTPVQLPTAEIADTPTPPAHADTAQPVPVHDTTPPPPAQCHRNPPPPVRRAWP